MYNKEAILESLDAVIRSAQDRLTTEELVQLVQIRDNLAAAVTEATIIEAVWEIIKFMMMLHEVFGNK